MKHYDLYLNGQWQTPTNDDWIEVVNPANKEVIARVPAADETMTNQAVEGAHKALPAWKATPPEERIRLVEAIYTYFKENEDKIAGTISQELGSPAHVVKERHVSSYYGEIDQYLQAARDLEWVETHEGFELHREPVGVAALITPWNYPFGQVLRKVFPALLTGNTVVVKPSQKTPLTAYYFAEAAHEAGLPAGVFQLVTGRGSEVGNVLASHPLVNKISFTGSTKGGIEISKLATDTVKRVTLELGGKSPAILLEDADLDMASTRVLNTLFLNVGQTCSAASRVIAPRSKKKEVEDAFVNKAKTYTFGDPKDEASDAGPLQSEQQFKKVTGFIAKGKEQATLLYEAEPYSDEGYYIGPVLFTDVDNSSEIAQEEIFGPVLSIVFYDDLDEAVQLANDTKYGLSSHIYGDEAKAKELAKQILAGEVYINDTGNSSEAPFGGYKQSGYGREGNALALDAYIEVKAVIV